MLFLCHCLPFPSWGSYSFGIPSCNSAVSLSTASLYQSHRKDLGDSLNQECTIIVQSKITMYSNYTTENSLCCYCGSVCCTSICGHTVCTSMCGHTYAQVCAVTLMHKYMRSHCYTSMCGHTYAQVCAVTLLHKYVRPHCSTSMCGHTVAQVCAVTLLHKYVRSHLCTSMCGLSVAQVCAVTLLHVLHEQLKAE